MHLLKFLYVAPIMSCIYVQVEKHIISGCQDLIATSRPKESSLFHRCTYRKCKQKELVPIYCDKCHRNFCIRCVCLSVFMCICICCVCLHLCMGMLRGIGVGKRINFPSVSTLAFSTVVFNYPGSPHMHNIYS